MSSSIFCISKRVIRLEQELGPFGFRRQESGVLETEGKLKFTVAEVRGQLCIYASIHDPFQEEQSFYVTCFSGELRQGGFETKTAFLSVYKQALGAESSDPLQFLRFAPHWIAEFSTPELVSEALEDALRLREKLPKAGIRWRLFEKLAGPFIQTPPLRSKTPPIYHYLQALLSFHSAKFDEAIAEAKHYLDSLRVHEVEEKHIIPLIRACEQHKGARIG